MIMDEIEEVAVGMVEAPDRRSFKSKKFSSGTDGYIGTEIQMETAQLERCAKAGCPGAKHTLITEHDVKYLMLGGKVIIQKVIDEVYQRPFH